MTISAQDDDSDSEFNAMVQAFMTSPYMDFDRAGMRKPARWETFARYLAYCSDLGEAFRPVIPRGAVRGTYAVSWMYCIVDTYQEVMGAERNLHDQIQAQQQIVDAIKTSEEERILLAQLLDDMFHRYMTLENKTTILPPVERRADPLVRAFQRGVQQSLDDKLDKLQFVDRYTRETCVKKMVFHTVASMMLPAITINLTVRASRYIWGSLLPATATRALRILPTATGLAIIPFLPFMFDGPVHAALEHMMSWRSPKKSA